MRMVVTLVVWVGFVFVSMAVGQSNPTISYISRDQIVNIGGTVNLECAVEDGQDFSVMWVKVDTTNPSGFLTLFGRRENRFSLHNDTANSTFTLQIRDIQESDVGVYQCQGVVNISNIITANVSVLVRIPPVIADNSTRSQITSEGMSVKLECYATGFPHPNISWRRQNNDILPIGGSVYQGNILIIPSVKKEDRGTYYCVADNGVRKGARRNINVEVEFAPVVRTPRPSVGQALNYDMDLECHVEAYPPPAIKWVKDDREIANSMHYQIANFATADEFTDSTVRVITIETNQYGNYTCSAQNKHGSHHATVELFETPVPMCPPACEGFSNTTESSALDNSTLGFL